MRLFTGFDIPAEIVAALDQLIDQIRPTARIKWSPPANLHITTRFIGEWPEERLPDLLAALNRIPRRPPIPIQIRNLGFFPNPHSPRIFWAGVEAPPELAALAAETDQALDALGLKPEGRPFRPHLTLARIKDPVPLQKLRETIAALPSIEFGAFRGERFPVSQPPRTGWVGVHEAGGVSVLQAEVS